MTTAEATPGPRKPTDAELGLVPAALRPAVDLLLIDEQAIQKRLTELAAQIDADHEGHDVLIVGVLKGAFVVIADLVRHMRTPCAVDFMAVSSYGSSTKTSGVVRILKDLDTEIAGRHVIVVEDIIDSGLTLDYLLRNLRSRGPASIEVLALLTKPSRRRVDVPIRYRGFEVDDLFVVGYGLDYDEQYRNLPFICTLADVD